MSELAQNVDENLVIENGASSVSKAGDVNSPSTTNQNGKV